MKYLLIIFWFGFLATRTEAVTEKILEIRNSVVFNEKNFDEYIGQYNVVFVNFYAKWCYYSKKLLPEFDQASRILSEQFPRYEVLLGKVDCELEKPLAKRFKIGAYPSLLLFVNGVPLGQKYYGPRTSVKMVRYVNDHYWKANTKINI